MASSAAMEKSTGSRDLPVSAWRIRRWECQVCGTGVATEKFPLFKQERFRPPIAVYTHKTCRQLPSPGDRLRSYASPH